MATCDLARMILGVDPDRVRRRVVLAPCWHPDSVGVVDSTPISVSADERVWDCCMDGEPFTYILGGVGAGLCADVVLALETTACEELLFLGSAGAISDRVLVGDIAIVDGSICAEGATRYFLGDSLSDSFGLLSAANKPLSDQIALEAERQCAFLGVALWRGIAVSVESIYMQGGFISSFQDMGASFVDMESSAVLAASQKIGISAAVVFCVSDNQLIGESLAELDDNKVSFRKSVRKDVMPGILSEFTRETSVTAVIPSFNGGAYICECVDSLLKDAPAGLEIILVDDGSTDNTGNIVDCYAAKHRCVRAIHQPHRGLSCARNAGLAAAHGEYIYFADDDDLPVSGFLGWAYQKAKCEGLDFLNFSFEAFCDDAELRENYAEHFIGAKRTVSIAEPVSGRELFVALVHSNEYYPVVWIQLVKRELLVRNSIMFHEGLLFEDNLYTLTVMLAAKRSVCITDVGYRKRFREGSITISPETEDKVNSFLFIFQEMTRVERREVNQAVKWAIQSELDAIEAQLSKRYKRLSEEQKKRVDWSLGEGGD